VQAARAATLHGDARGYIRFASLAPFDFAQGAWRAASLCECKFFHSRQGVVPGIYSGHFCKWEEDFNLAKGKCMPRLQFFPGMIACLLLWSGVAMAGAPNNDSTITGRVFVPDSNNNRFLIYKQPTGNGDSADIVLGQGNFTTNAAGTSATTMSAPTEFARDDDGNLYVSDSGNCRVLIFTTPFKTGQAAKVVLGEPDANTGCGALPTSATTVLTTGGLAFDNNGNLWVADIGNSRILRFKAPFKTGKAADIVLGQPDFSSSTGVEACFLGTAPTAGNLCSPIGLAFDSSNNLWVADAGYSRILEFKSPKKNMNASVELGHPAATAFTSAAANDGGLSASSLNGPTGIGIDNKDRLWVADTGNSRVLRFNPKIKNDDAATVVLGQPGFLVNSTNQGGFPSALTLDGPQGIEIRPDGVLWVGDSGNNRTLSYEQPFTTGMTASQVLGQPDFVQNGANQNNATPNENTQDVPFNAGVSFLALAVLVILAGGRELLLRRRRRAQLVS